MKLGITRMGKLALSLAVVAGATLASGCAIHSQGPVKEVAYDFSDGVLYDRAYAPSPEYETGLTELAPLRQRADARARTLAAAEAARMLPVMPPASLAAMVAAEPTSEPPAAADVVAAASPTLAPTDALEGQAIDGLAALDETPAE
jgi:hypothetical protein